jgi:Zn-dependent protease
MELIIFYLVVILFSAIIHEYMHGWAADYMGDPTAKRAGRLTLNPIAHIDLWGSILLPLFIYLGTNGGMVFGYAKPVPFNPYNLRDQKYGPAKVAIAGPLANLATALFFGLILRFFPLSGILPQLLAIIVITNLILMTFNLLPIPPLDGSKVLMPFLPYNWQVKLESMERYGIIILLLFVFFGFATFILPIINFLFKIIVGASFF